MSTVPKPRQPAFDYYLRELLDAFVDQDERRKAGAPIRDLAAGNKRLFDARMAVVDARRRRDVEAA
jgi:hypothetical protein